MQPTTIKWGTFDLNLSLPSSKKKPSHVNVNDADAAADAAAGAAAVAAALASLNGVVLRHLVKEDSTFARLTTLLDAERVVEVDCAFALARPTEAWAIEPFMAACKSRKRRLLWFAARAANSAAVLRNGPTARALASLPALLGVPAGAAASASASGTTACVLFERAVDALRDECTRDAAAEAPAPRGSEANDAAADDSEDEFTFDTAVPAEAAALAEAATAMPRAPATSSLVAMPELLLFACEAVLGTQAVLSAEECAHLVMAPVPCHSVRLVPSRAAAEAAASAVEELEAEAATEIATEIETSVEASSSSSSSSSSPPAAASAAAAASGVTEDASVEATVEAFNVSKPDVVCAVRSAEARDAAGADTVFGGVHVVFDRAQLALRYIVCVRGADVPPTARAVDGVAAAEDAAVIPAAVPELMASEAQPELEPQPESELESEVALAAGDTAVLASSSFAAQCISSSSVGTM